MNADDQAANLAIVRAMWPPARKMGRVVPFVGKIKSGEVCLYLGFYAHVDDAVPVMVLAVDAVEPLMAAFGWLAEHYKELNEGEADGPAEA